MNPKYPIYVISKGRWQRTSTINTMHYINAPFTLVVEPDEYKYYKDLTKNILVSPENFSERGQGSVPVRNFVWEHSLENKFDWHWVLDDNIESIERFNNNLKIKCKTATPFKIIEDFVDRYKNIGQAGMHYGIFCPANEARSPIQFNTRVYSCILQNNHIQHRWRGKYNEDTDLSLRILKDGYVTVLFRAFLIGKRATLTQKGGNEYIYQETDNRLEFAESLQKQHPDIVKVTKKFGRWHHQVNYKPFKDNDLILKDNISLKNITNNYGMKLIKNEVSGHRVQEASKS